MIKELAFRVKSVVSAWSRVNQVDGMNGGKKETGKKRKGKKEKKM